MKICLIYRLPIIWLIVTYRIDYICSTEDVNNSQTGTELPKKAQEPVVKSDGSKTNKSENSKRKGVLVAMDDEKSTDEFEFTKGNKTMTYTAKEGYGFNEVKWLRSVGYIMRADRNVWKTGNPSNFAHKVVTEYLGWLKYDLYVYQFNGNMLTFHRSAWGSKWSHTRSELLVLKSTNISKSEHPKELTVLTIGKDGSTKENDISQYCVHRNSMDNRVISFEFEFKDGIKCVGLRYLDHSLWKHDKEKLQDKYPSSIYLKPHSKVVLISFKDMFQVYVYRQKTWRLMFSGNPDPVEVDIRKKESTASYDYFKNDSSKCSLYIAKPGFMFSSVKQSKQSSNAYSKELGIWKANNKSAYAYLVILEGVGSSSKRVHIHLVDGTIKSFYKLKKPHHWSTQHWYSGLLLPFDKSSKYSEHQPADIKIITRDGSGFHENDISYYDVLVETTSGSEYLFMENKHVVRYVYLFKEGVKCVEIRKNEETMWKHDKASNRYPQYVVYLSIVNKILVLFDQSLSLEYSYKDKKWMQVIKKLENLELDIDSKKDGDEGSYRFFKDDSTKTYVYLSTGSMFSKVKQADKVVLESTEAEQHAHLVVVKDIEISPQVTAYLANGKVKAFKLGSDGKFIESDLKDFSDLYFAKQLMSSELESLSDGAESAGSDFSASHLSILTQGSDNSQPSANDKSKYDVYEDDSQVEFEFKDGVKCVGLKYLDASVWKHDKDKHKDEYPKSVFVYFRTNTLMLTFGDEKFLYVFKLVGNEWKTLANGKINLLQLDVAKKECATEYDYFNDGNFGTFEVNGNNLFKEVIRKKPTCECGSDFTFLQATDPGQYVYKVVRDGLDSMKCMNNVTLFLINGQIKKIKNFGNCVSRSWRDVQRVWPEELKDQKLKEIEVKDHPTELKLRSKDQPASDNSEGGDQSSSINYVVKKGLDDVFHYELDGFKCVEVKYENEVVWTTGDLEKDHPISLHFVKLANTIIFTFPDESYYLYRRIKNGDKFGWECYKLEKLGKQTQFNIRMTSIDGKHFFKNSGFKYFGFGTQIKLKDGFNLHYIYLSPDGKDARVSPFWSHNSNKYKDSYPKIVYYFHYENVLVLYDKNSVLSIDNDMKVDPKAKPTGSSDAGKTGSGNPSSTDSSGTNPSGQSGSTTPDPGGGTPTNPASAT